MAADEIGEAYRTLMKDVSPAVVSVKFVMTAAGEEGGQEREIIGVMIESDGLVLVSNTMTGGMTEELRAQMGDYSLLPKDIKVMIGDDTEGVEAKLIARDSEVDLAWIKIEKPEKSYSFVDFAQGGTVQVGDTLLGIERMHKVFDRQTTVREARVSSITTKPRELINPSQAIGSVLATPVFGSDAKPVGVTVLFVPGLDKVIMERETQINPMILPAAEIVEATKRAKEFAASGQPVDPEPVAGPEVPELMPEMDAPSSPENAPPAGDPGTPPAPAQP